MISVCIATYNGARYIAEQLASILKQLSAEDEVVVSDDGSTDGTIDIVRSLNDRRIRIVDGPRRHSPTLNFEWALRNAKGEYIFLADQDDVWLEGKVTRCVEELQKCDCVVSDARVTDSLLNTTSESLFQLMHVRRGRLSNLLWRNGYTGCCMAFKREVLSKALPFPSVVRCTSSTTVCCCSADTTRLLRATAREALTRFGRNFRSAGTRLRISSN